MSDERRAHWDGVYDRQGVDEVSWFQPTPERSLALIRRVGASRDTPIVDVGGGGSMLVDALLADGFRDLTVLDIASAALDQAKARLDASAADVDWILADITSWAPQRAFGLWHDRAVLHFLIDPAEQAGYADALRAALAPEGWAIIGGFAPGGPIKCSGLDVVQHDAVSLGRLLGDDFQLMETHGETHVTPWGADQSFRYHLFRRKPHTKRGER